VETVQEEAPIALVSFRGAHLTIAFDSDKEPWTTYRLADGTLLKFKIVLVSVKRREGEFQADGNPMYDFQCQQLVHIDAPDELKLTHEAPKLLS
jgi:hypothetical protein